MACNLTLPAECLSWDAVYRIASALSPAVETDALGQVLAFMAPVFSLAPFQWNGE